VFVVYLLFISAVGKHVQELPENRTCHLAGQKQYFFSSIDQFMGYLIWCPSCENVHEAWPVSLSAAFQLQVLPVKESYLFILLCFSL